MFTNRIRIAAAGLALALFAAASAAAQQQPPAQQQPRPTPTPAPSVNHRSFQSMVFEVRHREPDTLVPVLRLLTSGFDGAGVSADRNFRVITVRDFPENVASIGEAIKRLDTPEGERPGVELRMHVLLASDSAAPAAAAPPPAELRDVLTQLQSTLNYKGYELLTSVVQRTRESRGRESGYLQGNGTAESAPVAAGGEKHHFSYNFSADSLSLTSASAGPASVQLGNFNFNIANHSSKPTGMARIRSDVSMREGERVVVGTAGMGDRALILVLTARTLK